MKQQVEIILKEAAKRIEQSMKDSDRVASGKTVKSFKIHVDNDGNGGRLTGAGHIRFLIEGRNPTHTKKNWKGGKGGAPLDPLEKWAKSKGINVSPWAIKFKIDTEGYKGTKDLLSKALDANFQNWAQGIIKEGLRTRILEYRKEQINGFNRNT